MKSKLRKFFALLLSLVVIIGTGYTCPVTANAADAPLIIYSGHQQSYGNLQKVADGTALGLTGRAKRLEALTIYKGSALNGLSGDIECQAHVQNIGGHSMVSFGTHDWYNRPGKKN